MYVVVLFDTWVKLSFPLLTLLLLLLFFCVFMTDDVVQIHFVAIFYKPRTKCALKPPYSKNCKKWMGLPIRETVIEASVLAPDWLPVSTRMRYFAI